MRKLIGLDIGSTTIKLVELEKNGKINKLVAAGLVPAPPKGFLSEAKVDQLALAQAIKKLASDCKVTTKQVNVALPENLIFSRVVEMPALSEKELASAIRWEAEQYIPIPLTEAVLDYQIVQTNHDGKTGLKMEVFLVAAPKNLVTKYKNVITAAGLELVALETEALALHRALIEESPTSPATLIVSIGADSTTIVAAKGGYIVLTHVLPTGGKALTRALAADFNLDITKAEEYKKTYGLNQDVLSGQIGKTVKPLLDKLVSELKQAMIFYQNKSLADATVVRTIVVGGSAKLPGLIPYLAENLGIETLVGDPQMKLTDSKLFSGPTFDPILFSEAVGLALKPL